MTTAQYNGTTVEVTDEQSHRSKSMLYIVGDGLEGWVFAEAVDGIDGIDPN